LASLLSEVLNSITGPIFQGGRLLDDAVKVQVGVKEYHGWNSVALSLSMSNMASTFTINTADRWRQTDEKFPVMPGNEVRVFAGIDSIITGFIDQFDAEVTNEDRNIVFSGRSRTGDLIDSAAIARTATYTKLTLQQIATIYAQDFDIVVIDESRTAADIFSKVVVNQSETIFELLLRLAKERNVLLTSNSDGNLVITDRLPGNTAAAAGPPLLGQGVRASIGTNPGLFQGRNVLRARSNYDETDRFQKYLVKSQIQANDFVKTRDASTIQAVAFDKGVLRQRTKYIIAEKSMDNAGAKKRATWEANTRAALAAKATVVVAGWRDQSGKLWGINQLVDTDLRFIGFTKGQYLITDVLFAQVKDRGTLTQVGITRADAYSQQEPEVANDPKKDAGWDSSIFGTELREAARNLGL